MSTPNRSAVADRKLRIGLTVAAVLACLPAGAAAGQPAANASVQVLRPGEVGKVQSHMPGSPHGHVIQRGTYGQTYRYGHSVNNAMGDIIIWSPRTGSSYGMQHKTRFGPKYYRVRPQPPTGPRLQYKPDYGDPPLRRRD